VSAEAGASPGRRGRKLLAIPAIVFLALAALLYFRLHSGDPSTLPSALIGRPAPGVALPALENLVTAGGPMAGFSRADLLSGEVTVVNVFASWCVPCRQEHPVLMQMRQAGIRLFGLNYKDDPENARRFLGGLGNPFSRVGVDPNGRGAIEWGVYGVPETFVVTGDGRIAYKFVGPLTPETFEAVLKPQIEKAATPR
jgi:cytochrome c biogenesis protein CcmG/thiol:disulfide interchange protein DsbE